MKKHVFERIMYIVMCAFIYMIFDIPVQLTGFLKFGPCIGLKNALTPILGLALGPYGVIGSVIGCICSSLVMEVSWQLIAFESVCNVVIGIMVWLTWHLTSRSHKINFKNFLNYVRYISALIVFSALCGFVGSVIIDEVRFLPVTVSYTVLGILVGIPISVIINSVLCVKPVIPGWCVQAVDLEGTIEPNDSSLIAFNARIERFTEEHGCSVKKTFEIINTIEEVYLRIRANEPDTMIHVTLDFDDTLSIRFMYQGEKHNPLKISSDEDLVALIGLKLIEHRAIRTSYKYSQNINYVHVVI